MATLLDDIRLITRTSTKALDSELSMLIEAAKRDMVRVGVREELVNPDDDADIDPLVKQAIACYCKAHFGYDNSEARRFSQSYRQTVCDLMNSDANSAAQEEVSE